MNNIIRAGAPEHCAHSGHVRCGRSQGAIAPPRGNARQLRRVEFARCICRSSRGQSSVEFMLMLPVILAVFFFLVQMGLYFSTIHYATYSAFTLSRAQQVGFSQRYPSLSTLSKIVVTGLVWLPGDVNPLGASSSATGVSVSVNNFEQRVPFPFITGIEPEIQFDVKAYLGPCEARYEYVEGRSSRLYDTNVDSVSSVCGGR